MNGDNMAILAMLLQSELDASLTADAIRARLLEEWSSLDAETVTAEPEGAPGDPVMLSIGESIVALVTVQSAIADDTAELVEHSRLWPAGEAFPTDYGAHTIVTVMRSDGEGYESAIDQAQLLSRVVATLIGMTETVRGVYVGSANHVVLPTLFRELVQDSPDLLQPLLWVAVNIGQRPDDGAMTGFTRGLDMLQLMDIEIPESPQDASGTFDQLVSIAMYQLEHGPIIGDGNTIGETDVAQITARHRSSAFGDGRTVLSLEYLSAQPTKRKRGLFRRK